jgi:hypothetical protein
VRPPGARENVCTDVCTATFGGYRSKRKIRLKWLILFGGRTRTRTLDPLIKSQQKV